MYIYEIKNVVTGHRYIGQTIVDPKNRWKAHRSELRRNVHHNEHLQRAWKKYGMSNFQFAVLNETSSWKELDVLEDRYIKKYSPLVYNIKSGGEQGYRHSTNTRFKMSKARKTKWQHPEYRKIQAERLRKMSGSGGRAFAKTHSKTYDGFVSPRGKVYSPVINLSKFCRIHRLILSHMQSVDLGERHTHRGWTKCS